MNNQLILHFTHENKPCKIQFSPAKPAFPPQFAKIHIGGREYVYNKEDPKIPEHILNLLPEKSQFQSERELLFFISQGSKIPHMSITQNTYAVGVNRLIGKTHIDTELLSEEKQKLHQELIKISPEDQKAILACIERANPAVNQPKALFEIAEQIENEGNVALAKVIRDRARPFDLQQIREKVPVLIADHYVDADQGKVIAKKIAEHLLLEKYEKFYDPVELTDELSLEFKELGGDKHLEICFWPAIAHEFEPQEEEEVREKKVEARVEQGVGYLNILHFDEPKFILQEAEAALNQIRQSNPETIIIDLRDNSGGSQRMMVYIASHFINPDVQLSQNYYRDPISEEEEKVFPTGPVKTLSEEELPKDKRMLEAKLIILTSDETLSAAESLAYHLRHERQALLIGEPTGGGAHVAKLFEINKDFLVGIAFGDYQLTSGEKNWEGRGLTPDVEVKADQAEQEARKHIT